MRSHEGLFGGMFDRGAADTGDEAWLQAMLDTEAALARAVERAGLAAAGRGGRGDRPPRGQPPSTPRSSAGRPRRPGTRCPPLVRALTAAVPAGAAAAVHQGATSQDIIDTAAMLMARGRADRRARRPGRRRGRRRRPGGRAPGHDHDRPDAAAAGRAGDVRPGRGRLADRDRRGQAGPGPGPRPAARRAVRRGRRDAGRARRRRARGSACCWPRNSGWPRRRCPGTPTGCGSPSWPRRWPGPAPRWRQDGPGRHPAGPVRGGRGPRGRRGRGGSSAMPHKRNPVAAVAITRLHPAGCPACWPPWPLPPSRNISAPRAPGTPSGSRSPTCSG